MKKVLVCRWGAFGDCIITTPVIRKLKQDGWEIYYATNERGGQILKLNPHITKFFETKTDSIKDMDKYLGDIKKEYKIDEVVNLSESIEVDLSLHPRSPRYMYSKQERFEMCNINFYEHTFTKFPFLDMSMITDESMIPDLMRPELFFSEEELKEAQSYMKPDKFNIMIGMAGSGNNKAWPWTELLCGSILNEMKEHVHIITVGDVKCKLIEPVEPKYITNLADKTSMRVSCAMTKFADLLISPDTGLLHASGCYDTPKIGMIGHNTIENITKYFSNDYSLQSDPELATCAPCFRMIYDMPLQCPQCDETGAAWCMQYGIKPELVFEQVKKVYVKSQNRS